MSSVYSSIVTAMFTPVLLQIKDVESRESLNSCNQHFINFALVRGELLFMKQMHIGGKTREDACFPITPGFFPLLEINTFECQ